MLVNAEKCTGCGSCELACSFVNTGAFNPEKSRIKIIHLDGVGFSNPVVCLFCKNPPCVEVCPTGALSQTQLGTIHLDEKKCTGCGLCADKCIVGAINFDQDRGLPLICDLCKGENPACVEWCPTGALTINSSKENGARKALKYTMTKARSFLKKGGIPKEALDYYRTFLNKT